MVFIQRHILSGNVSPTEGMFCSPLDTLEEGTVVGAVQGCNESACALVEGVEPHPTNAFSFSVSA